MPVQQFVNPTSNDLNDLLAQVKSGFSQNVNTATCKMLATTKNATGWKLRIVTDDTVTMAYDSGARVRVHFIGWNTTPPWFRINNENWVARSAAAAAGFTNNERTVMDEEHGGSLATGVAPARANYARGLAWRFYIAGGPSNIDYASQWVFGPTEGSTNPNDHNQAFNPACHSTGAQTLPTGTINVDTTATFPTSGTFWFGNQVITYTGKSGTTFTGCTGGSGSLPAGSDIVGPPNVSANKAVVDDEQVDYLMGSYWSAETARISGSDGVTNGTNTFTSATATFVAGDVGKPLGVGADTRTITAFNSPTSVNYAGTAIASATGVPWTVGGGWFEVWIRYSGSGGWVNVVRRKNGIYTTYPDFGGPYYSQYYQVGQGVQQATDNFGGYWGDNKLEVLSAFDTQLGVAGLALTSATVIGASLTVGWSRTLDAGFVPATSAWNVLVNGVTRGVTTVTISGNNVTLTLASPVGPGDTVTLGYVKPAANYLRDSGGTNQAASFASLPVLNGTVAGGTISTIQSFSVSRGATGTTLSTPNVTLTAGDDLIIGCGWVNATDEAAGSSMADTLGNTYVQVGHSWDTTAGYPLVLYRCRVTVSGTTQITLTMPASRTFSCIFGLEVSGADGTTPIRGYAITTPPSAAANTLTDGLASPTTSFVAGDKAVGLFMGTGSTWSPANMNAGTGFTERIDDVFGFALEDGNVASNGTRAATWTFLPAQNVTGVTYLAAVVVLQASAGAPVNTVLPGILGTAALGSSLSLSTGSWSGSPSSYSYLWEESSNGGATWTTVSTASSYTPTATSEVGKIIRGSVVATNGTGPSIRAYATAMPTIVDVGPAPPIGQNTKVSRAQYMVEVAWGQSERGLFTFGVSQFGSSVDVLAASQFSAVFSGPLDDITSPGDGTHVETIGITRGRDNDLVTTQAGTAVITIRDMIGKFNRDNPRGPLRGYLDGGQPMRVSAIFGGLKIPLFYGFIDSVQYNLKGRAAQVQIHATDFFAKLSPRGSKTDTGPILPSAGPTTTGAAIGRILDHYQWIDPALRSLAVGDSIPDFAADGSKTGLAMIEELLVAERGFFFVRADGGIVYQSRTGRYTSSSQASIDAVMDDYLRSSDTSTVVNRWVVTRTNLAGVVVGAPQQGDSVDSQNQFNIVDDSIQTPYLNTDNDALALAQYLASLTSRPTAPVWDLSLQNKDDATLYQILHRDLSDRVTVTERVGPSTVDYFIQQINHQIDLGGCHHSVSWRLQRSPAFKPFIFGVSQMGSGDQLTF